MLPWSIHSALPDCTAPLGDIWLESLSQENLCSVHIVRPFVVSLIWLKQESALGGVETEINKLCKSAPKPLFYLLFFESTSSFLLCLLFTRLMYLLAFPTTRPHLTKLVFTTPIHVVAVPASLAEDP